MSSEEYTELKNELTDLKRRLANPQIEIVGFKPSQAPGSFMVPLDWYFQVNNVGLLPIVQVRVFVAEKGRSAEVGFDHDNLKIPLWPGETRQFQSRLVANKEGMTVRVEVQGKVVLDKLLNDVSWKTF